MRHALVGLLLVLSPFSPAIAADAKSGETVFAFHQATEAYFAATVVEEDSANKGQFQVVFEDGDTALVSQAQMKSVDLKPGLEIYARWKDKKFYKGTIAKVVGRALYIEYKDGDKGWASMGNIAIK